jgi:hypothetical protein
MMVFLGLVAFRALPHANIMPRLFWDMIFVSLYSAQTFSPFSLQPPASTVVFQGYFVLNADVCSDDAHRQARRTKWAKTTKNPSSLASSR